MDKRYQVSGIFNLEVDGKDSRQACETAKRILECSGIDGIVIDVEEAKTDE